MTMYCWSKPSTNRRHVQILARPIHLTGLLPHSIISYPPPLEEPESIMARLLDDDALCFNSYVLHLHQAPIKVGDGGIIDAQVNYALRIIIPKEHLPIHRERTLTNRIDRWRYLGIRDQPYLDQETSHQAPCPDILIPHPNLHPGLSFLLTVSKEKGADSNIRSLRCQ